MQERFRLLVFDWDGTLMDSAAHIAGCMRAAAADLMLPVPSDAAARDVIGLGLPQAMANLFPEADPVTVPRIIERYRHHFFDPSTEQGRLFPGAQALLQQLSEQGYLLSVATGKGRPGLDRALEETGLGALFHATRSADETHSKPHPEMLLQLLDELGVDAGEALMIGDTEYDMQMAVNAGVAGLAVSYGVHSRERLLQHRPQGCIDALGELSGWLAATDLHTTSQV